LTKHNTSNRLQHRREHDSKKVELTEMQTEIECPRCFEIMTLCAGFDSLCYICGKCNLSLHTQKNQL